MNEISQNVKILLEKDSIDEDIDAKIDDLVYQLYSISDDEKKYIKNWFNERKK